jgi:hypothetical protein
LDSGNGNGHVVTINGCKGIWTLESVINLLNACNVKYRIAITGINLQDDFVKLPSTEADEHPISCEESANMVEERR